MPIFSFTGYTLTKFRKPIIDDKLINKRVRLFILDVKKRKKADKKKIIRTS